MPGSLISGLSGSGVGECPICLGCLDNPVFTSCGHQFCLSCIRSHISHSRSTENLADLVDPPSPPACPSCRHPISEEEFVGTPFCPSTTPSPIASVQGVDVLARFARRGNARVTTQGRDGSHSHRHHHHRPASELVVALPASELAVALWPSGWGELGESFSSPARPSGASTSGADDERERDFASPLLPTRVCDTRARSRVDGLDQATTNPFRTGRTETTTTTPVGESSLLCPYRLRRFVRRSLPSARRVSRSSRIIARLRNLIILSSFIMIIQGIANVCFWEDFIKVNRKNCMRYIIHDMQNDLSALQLHINSLSLASSPSLFSSKISAHWEKTAETLNEVHVNHFEENRNLGFQISLDFSVRP